MLNTGITLTASMRSNLSSLRNISSQMDKTQNILSTGKKVNSAIDNASSYYQARSLTNRAADLNSLLDSMGQGIQTIQAASEGLESATSYLEQMKSVAEQALALPDNSNTTNAPQKVPMQSKVELVDNSAELIAQGYTAVSTSAELTNALRSNAKIVLTDDIELTSGYHGSFSNSIINGGGHTLTMNNTSINCYGGSGNVFENIDIDMNNGSFHSTGKISYRNVNIDYEGEGRTLLYCDDFVENLNINVKSDGAVVCVRGVNDNLDIKNLTINHTSGDGYVIGAYAKGDVNVDGMSVISNSENNIGLWAAGEVNGVATGITQNIPSSLTDGKANTQAIVQQLGEDGKAAYATTQFYVGDKKGEFGQGKWYLPSIGELMDLYGTDYEAMESGAGTSGAVGDNMSAINTTLGELAKDGIAEKMNGRYWSSSEDYSDLSWTLLTSLGDRTSSGKYNGYQVRSFLLYENCFNSTDTDKPVIGDIMYLDGSWGTLADYDSADSDQVAGVICGVGDDGSVKVVSLKDLRFTSSSDDGVFDPEDPYGGSSKSVRWATYDKCEENVEAITDVNEAGLAAAYRPDKVVTVETINNTFAENTANNIQLSNNSAELLAQGYTAVDSSMTSQDIMDIIDELASNGDEVKLVLTEDIELEDYFSIDYDNVTFNGGGHTFKYNDDFEVYGMNTVIENINLKHTGEYTSLYIYSDTTLRNININHTFTGNWDQSTIYFESGNGTIENVNINSRSLTNEYIVFSGVYNNYGDLDIQNLTMDMKVTNGATRGIEAYGQEDGYGNVNVDNINITTNSTDNLGIYANGSITGLDEYVKSEQVWGEDVFTVSIDDINKAFSEKSNISYSDYINQYGHIINEFNTLIEDASYQGVNLLTGGGLNVVFNEARTHSFAVKGEDIRSDQIGLTTINWSSKSDVETAISEITSAIDKLRNLATDLGNKYTIIQTRQNFTDALTDVLETGADNLVLADMNETSAEYLMLQTRQQLAVNSLSLASQSASSILSLF